MNEHQITLAHKIKDAFHNTDEVTLTIQMTTAEREACLNGNGVSTEFEQWLEECYSLEISSSDFDPETGILTCDVFSNECCCDCDIEIDDDECEWE